MAAGAQPWSPVAGGLRVRVRLTPKSSRDEIVGIEATAEGQALKARVRALPEDGKANAAIAETLAKWLGVPKSNVTLAAGAKSRIKTLHVAGPAGELETLITARLAADAG